MLRKGKWSEYNEETVSQLSDILQLLAKYPSLEFFRGQGSYRWKLVPKISRLFEANKIPDTWPRLESFILDDFQKYAIAHLDREPRSKFEWLVIGQHYGLPTRLLDWTTNPLKAAYFAVSDGSIKQDGALFAFSPTAYLPRFTPEEDIDQMDYFYPIFPDMLDSRIIAQEGCFTVFPHAKDYKPFRPMESIRCYDGVYHLLLKMLIPRDRKTIIRQELNRLGVNSRTMFPDLSGISDFITWKCLQGLL